MILLGRNGVVATKLYGFGYLFQNGELTEVRESVTLSVSHLWHNWFVPGDNPNAIPIPGNPKPFPFLVIGRSDGVPHLLRGLKDENCILLWNYVSGQWEATPTPNFPIAVKAQIPQVSALEIVGFQPLLPNELPSITRPLVRLAGAGMLVSVEQMTEGNCPVEGVSGPCSTHVTYPIPFPEIGVKCFFEWHAINGPQLVPYVEPDGSGGSGDNGNDGDEGPQGPQGPAGLGVASGVINSSGHLVFTMTDGTTRSVGYVKGPEGPRGFTGNDGAPGASGVDSVNGDDGADGADGSDGSPGGLSEGDLASIYTPCQVVEFLTSAVEISGGNRETLDDDHEYTAAYHLGHGGPITLPAGTDLVSIDRVIVRVMAVSTDPQVEEATSQTHSLRVRLNAQEVLFLDDVDPTAAGTDPGAFYPRLSVLSGGVETSVAYGVGAEIEVRINSVKHPTVPGASQFTKYHAGKNRVRVYVVGFHVTRRKNPILIP